MNNLANKTVLVTGAAGFIGSHLTERLVALGARTRILVRYTSRGDCGWLTGTPAAAGVEVFRADLGDRRVIANALRGADVVLHLAALIGIPYSYEAPSSYVRTNVEGTMNLLEAARDAGVSRFVHTSTSEVYGTAQSIPIGEDHPLCAQSPYAASKIAADKFAESFNRAFGLPVVTVRPFNTYGPRQSARAVVPTIVLQALDGGPVKLGNVTPTRDMIYVDDTVDGFIRAAGADAAVGSVINLGTGREISIRDLAAAIGRVVGRPLDLRVEEPRVRVPGSEVERLCASTSRARSLLQWEAATPLEEGLRRTVEWIRAHRHEYKVDGYAV
ncbi:MAG: GDP-mannose 4,6-dehydratase [Acidobacteriia bacterium]|nr:GDP-mannose 4,6-dehydratase [Terriglobia bacterium]